MKKGGTIELDQEILERVQTIGEDFGIKPNVTTLLVAEYIYQVNLKEVK